MSVILSRAHDQEALAPLERKRRDKQTADRGANGAQRQKRVLALGTRAREAIGGRERGKAARAEQTVTEGESHQSGSARWARASTRARANTSLRTASQRLSISCLMQRALW